MTRQQRFEALAGDVAEPVLRYARRRADAHTAEEVLAETLLVAWRRLDEIPAGGELPWCFAVARHHLANAARSAPRRNLNVFDRPRQPRSGCRVIWPATRIITVAKQPLQTGRSLSVGILN